jgi:hypothetical protein
MADVFGRLARTTSFSLAKTVHRGARRGKIASGICNTRCISTSLKGDTLTDSRR